MRVRYTRQARADPESIYVYIDKRSPNAARAVKSTIQEAINGLADHPYIGRPSNRQSDVRALSIVRYPYIVFYRVVRDEVRIIHVRHSARRPWEENDEGSR